MSKKTCPRAGFFSALYPAADATCSGMIFLGQIYTCYTTSPYTCQLPQVFPLGMTAAHEKN
ncbi:MAG: hypothetical protein WDA53_06770 [Bacillota bacterium]